MPENLGYQFNRVFALPIETNRTVSTLSARDAIPASLRYEGMLCYVTTESQEYQLRGGILNTNWIEINGTGQQPPIPNSYDTLGLLLADQANQTENFIYRIADASGFTSIDSGYAYVQYKGTIAGDETDYNIIAKEKYGGKFVDGTNPLNAVYLDGNVGIGKQPTELLDVNGNIKGTKLISTGNIDLEGNQIQTINSRLILEQTGGFFGATYISLESAGVNGALFGCRGLDLVDFGFAPSTGYVSTIRYEHRTGLILGGTDQTVGEFQFFDTSIIDFPFTVNKNVTSVRLGQLGVGTDKPNALIDIYNTNALLDYINVRNATASILRLDNGGNTHIGLASANANVNMYGNIGTLNLRSALRPDINFFNNNVLSSQILHNNGSVGGGLQGLNLRSIFGSIQLYPNWHNNSICRAEVSYLDGNNAKLTSGEVEVSYNAGAVATLTRNILTLKPTNSATQTATVGMRFVNGGNNGEGFYIQGGTLGANTNRFIDVGRVDNNTNEAFSLRIDNNRKTTIQTLRLAQSYTVATLPTGTVGDIAYVTDASAVSYRAVATGGGVNTVLVFFDGTNWIYT